ncbi:MAG: extracellular solute-binding protein, partial [Oscillospiraceae bacterium]|nr:extracellular solute-binding protein [Oscillospiraceae bacterium]
MQLSKRILALLAAAVMVAALAACGGGGGSEPAPAAGGTSGGAASSSGGTTTAAPTDGDSLAGSRVSILTWTNPSTVAWLRGLGERLEAETGIILDISDIDSNNHPPTRQTRLMANDIDIVTFEGGFLRPNEAWNEEMRDPPGWQTFVEAGLFHDLTDYPFIDNFHRDLILDAYGYQGRIYGLMAGSIPLNGVFYNIDRFNELGLSIPGTWDEFVALCEAIRAAGYQPITNGAGDGWPLNMFMGLIANNYYLDQAYDISKALFLGEKAFTDPDILPLYRMREQFLSYMEPGVTGIPYSDVYGRFANESALMLADGSWAAGDVSSANPSFDFAYFPLPGLTPRADGLPHQMAAKFDFAMVVAENGPNR